MTTSFVRPFFIQESYHNITDEEVLLRINIESQNTINNIGSYTPLFLKNSSFFSKQVSHLGEYILLDPILAITTMLYVMRDLDIFHIYPANLFAFKMILYNPIEDSRHEIESYENKNEIFRFNCKKIRNLHLDPGYLIQNDISIEKNDIFNRIII